MPHIPDTAHETHDLELVAAFAAGDATGPSLDEAIALVSSCADCSELHRDLRSIASALPALPVPARPRDFRLTHEQAAKLRPSGLRGLIAALSGPRFAFAGPIGSGLAALGIVGILVTSGGTGTPAPVPAVDSVAQQAPEVAAGPTDGERVYAAASAAPLASAEAGAAAGAGLSSLDPAVNQKAPVSVAGDSNATSAGVPDRDAALADGDGTPSLPLAPIALVFLGSALVAARLLAGRLDRDR